MPSTTTHPPLPRNSDGNPDTSASYGEAWMVEVEYNTDWDGRVIDPKEEVYPRTFHGPFFTEAEATEWMDHFMPDSTDIHDIRVSVLNLVRP